MADSKDDPKPRKVIDVTEPGKSEPSASGKPIIVSNRPLLQRDPMVVGSEPAEGDIDNTPAGNVKRPEGELSSYQEGNAITPPSAPSLPKDVAKTTKTPATDSDKPAQVSEPADNESMIQEENPKTDTATKAANQEPMPESTKTTTEPVEQEEPETSPPEVEHQDEAAATNSESSTDVSKNDQPTPKTVTDETAKKAAEEKAAKLAEQEKTIESKKYYLPINTIEHRKDIRRAILLLVLAVLLALIWLDIVLDAGILKLGPIHSLTHFFNS